MAAAKTLRYKRGTPLRRTGSVMRIPTISRARIQRMFRITLSLRVFRALLFGLILSVTLSLLAHNSIEREQKKTLSIARHEVEHIVRGRFEQILNAMEFTRAFIISKERISREDFHAFLENVSPSGTYPEMHAMVFAEKVAAWLAKAA